MCSSYQQLPRLTGRTFQGSSLPPLFMTLFCVLPPQDSGIWWFNPRFNLKKWSGKNRGVVSNLVSACSCLLKIKHFVQKEQETLALIHILC